MRRACAAAPSSWMSASSYRRTPSSNESRPPLAAFSSRLVSDTNDLRNNGRYFFDRADGVQFAAIRCKPTLRGGVERKIEFAVINLVEAGWARFDILRHRDHAIAV